MSTLEAAISADFLPELEGVTPREKWLNCANDYPWYPLPWLMLASTEDQDSIQKANLWFNDEQRLHWLLNGESWQADNWLKDNLAKTISNNSYPAGEQQDITVHEIPVDPNTDVTRDALEVKEPGTATDQLEYTLDNARNNDEYAEKEVITDNVDKNPVDVNGVNIEEPAVDPIPEIIPGIDSKPAAPVATGAITNSIASPAAEPLAFEPFHSVDYFASQGIKLDLSAEPKDKFDRQLKSFTQWLKTMKKVTVQEAAAANADPLVEAQANQSNSGKEIITEAMALVLEKQGKNEKAADIYQKLLLLHPEKSVFFAARIEELKNKQ